MSSGEVTSNGSLRGSKGSFKVTGRAILPRFDADKLRTAKLRSALDASVTATGSWNDAMPPDRDWCTEGTWGPFYELSVSERERCRGLKEWTEAVLDRGPMGLGLFGLRLQDFFSRVPI
jgi:hypothetical protein